MSATQQASAIASRPTEEQFRRPGVDPHALLQEVIAKTVAGNFDPDAWVVMDQRDNTLIAEELLGGVRSKKFVYDFRIAGTRVAGISVIGAAELASIYTGIQHRLVSSWRKIGSLYVFTSYPMPGSPMNIITQELPALANEPDGYNIVCEIKDIKTGNIVQTEVFEAEYEWSDNLNNKKGGYFRKPHFAKIAQSKAYRNGVLRVIPQNVQMRWRDEQLNATNVEGIDEGVLAQKRNGVLQYCAAQGIPVDRRALEGILLSQIMGLAEAARLKDLDAFVASANSLGLIGRQERTEETETAEKPVNRASPRPNRPPPKRDTQEVDRGADPANRSPTERQTDGPAPGSQESPTGGEVASQAAETRTASTSASDAGKPPPFEHFLLDQFGDLTEDMPFTTAIAWATSFIARWQKLDFVTRDNLVMHNADAIEAARAANRDATNILAEMERTVSREDATHAAENERLETAEYAEKAGSNVIPPPSGREGWGSYIKAYQAAIKEVGPSEFLDWLAAQYPVFTTAPASSLNLIVKASVAHSKALEIDPPAMLAESLKPRPIATEQPKPSEDATTTTDRDRRDIDNLLSSLQYTKTAEDVRTFANSTTTATVRKRFLAEGKNDLAAEVTAAFEKRFVELGGNPESLK